MFVQQGDAPVEALKMKEAENFEARPNTRGSCRVVLMASYSAGLSSKGISDGDGSSHSSGR